MTAAFILFFVMQPFGDHLHELLQRRGPEGTQAWLSKRSGIDQSLISRIIRGEREATAETLQALATALGTDVASLIAGTDAAGRMSAVGDHVRRSDYEEAVRKVIEYEGSLHDCRAVLRSREEQLAEEVKARRQAERDAEQERISAEQARDDLADLQELHDLQAQELERYKQALARALAEFSSLKSRLADLEAELGDTKKSSKAGALFSGIAAVTGVATLAHFLGEDPPPPPPRKPRRKKATRRR